jgi:hypothetical protein
MTVIAGYGSAPERVARHPARLPKMQQVFSDDVAPATAGSMAGQEGA